MTEETDYDSLRDKIRSFRKLSVKKRLDWLYQAQKFLDKLPEENQEKRRKLRNKNRS